MKTASAVFFGLASLHLGIGAPLPRSTAKKLSSRVLDPGDTALTMAAWKRERRAWALAPSGERIGEAAKTDRDSQDSAVAVDQDGMHSWPDSEDGGESLALPAISPPFVVWGKQASHSKSQPELRSGQRQAQALYQDAATPGPLPISLMSKGGDDGRQFEVSTKARLKALYADYGLRSAALRGPLRASGQLDHLVEGKANVLAVLGVVGFVLAVLWLEALRAANKTYVSSFG